MYKKEAFPAQMELRSDQSSTTRGGSFLTDKIAQQGLNTEEMLNES